MPKAHVPLNPSVLQWLIDESGLSTQEVADKAKVDGSILRGWLTGDTRPSQGEFTRLRNALRRPSAIFFLQEPPARSSIPDALRSAPGVYGHALSQDERQWVRRSLRLQRLVSILRGRRKATTSLPKAGLHEEPEQAATRARLWLGVSIEEQVGWSSSSEAWRTWRSALDDKGVLVFLLQLGKSGIRGFSVNDPSAPLVAVNSAYNASARTFTVFHELAHLVLRDDAACVDVAAASSSSDGPAVERWCEAFSAAFLMPEEVILASVRDLEDTLDGFDLVENVAGRFGVSLRAAAIRLIRLGIEQPELYRRVDAEAQVLDRDKGFARGQPQFRPSKRFGELGPSTVTELLNARSEGVLNERDLRNYLRAEGNDIVELGELVRSVDR